MENDSATTSVDLPLLVRGIKSDKKNHQNCIPGNRTLQMQSLTLRDP